MHLFEAVASRYSCRAFLARPVPDATVRDILARAAHAVRRQRAALVCARAGRPAA